MLDRRFRCLVFALSLALFLAVPASAQQVLVQNGGTARVAGGSVWHLQGGTMDLGGVDTTAQLAETDGARVGGGTLTATRALNAPTAADVAGLGAVLSAGADLGPVTVTRGHTVQTASNGNQSIARYYDLLPSTTTSGLNATLTLRYADAEVPSGVADSTLALFKKTGGSWTKTGADSRDTSANTVTVTGVGSFSRWTLGSDASPLPVALAAFDGTATGEGVQLTWRTATERSNTGFAVQRRPAGTGTTPTWQTVGFVEGHGTTTSARTYRFTDAAPPYAADTLAYRLRQADSDGSATVTDPITVARGAVTRLQLEAPYPNPARAHVTVRFAIPETAAARPVRLRLYDVLGRRVQTVTANSDAGRHERRLSVDDLASGVYVLRLTTGDQTRTRRLTVVR
jgi:hypothetical protein